MGSTERYVRRLRIVNARGLHARAAAKLSRLAEEFAARITIANAHGEVTARSIMGMLMLAAARGSEIEVSAEGCDAAEALAAVGALVESGFGEGDGPG